MYHELRKQGTRLWFARHELRLAWRDWTSMMTAGGRTRTRTLAIALVILAVVMHAVAYSMVARFAAVALDPDKTTLVVVTGSAFLSWALMLSQAMESVTRAFYTRSDLDLLLSSPIEPAKAFAVRIAAIAVSVSAMAVLLASPFIDVLAAYGGSRWLLAYLAVAALGAAAVAAGALATTALFRMIGAKRTRLVAQIVAAIMGAGFVIGLQLAAIVSQGTLSRFTLLASAPVVAIAPDEASALWWPARALLGEPAAVVGLAAACICLLVLAIEVVAPRFADCVVAAAGTVPDSGPQRPAVVAFRGASPRTMLRWKEWTLLRRDPWLMSQTLMQLLYLLPPAFLLWRGFGGVGASQILLIPVLVMAAGQLAGGLAWLAISGEDAPELVATAPLTSGSILRAKVEAVMCSILLIFTPFIAALALLSPLNAAVAAIGIAIAAASATQIQLCFRGQAKRSHFRRRQTSSRVATFAEAFVSIAWAATAALAATGTALAAMPGAVAVGIMASAHLLSPHRA
ncbi:MAG TPA: permease [Xanthobacteraceae bacterium]|nr:permease [Xanthobacteraceae bacterium]